MKNYYFATVNGELEGAEDTDLTLVNSVIDENNWIWDATRLDEWKELVLLECPNAYLVNAFEDGEKMRKNLERAGELGLEEEAFDFLNNKVISTMEDDIRKSLSAAWNYANRTIDAVNQENERIGRRIHKSKVSEIFSGVEIKKELEKYGEFDAGEYLISAEDFKAMGINF